MVEKNKENYGNENGNRANQKLGFRTGKQRKGGEESKEWR